MTSSLDETVAAEGSIGRTRGLGGAAALERGAALGRYLIIEQLGAGGMGVVYSAFDPDLDRKVAIKLLHTREEGSARSTSGPRRLVREAQAMAKLTHPNVITVHDVGEVDRQVFVAMEFVDGETLGDWLEARPRPWDEVLDRFARAGRGLAAAHAAGIVHRDFKPENVMLSNQGRVLVMDFGLARGTDPSEPAESLAAVATTDGGSVSEKLTATGAMMGTPAYMAPEQHLGQPVDAATDQFSFCVALWEALYGERPFAGETFAALSFNVTQGQLRTPPSDAKVPRWLARALARGLSVEPAKRWPSMDALLAELAVDRRARRSRWVFLAAGAAIGAAVFGFSRLDDEEVCGGARARLAGVWDDARAREVRAAFDATGSSYAEGTFARVDTTLGRYARRWVEAHRDACEATHVRGEQSGALLDLRMSCLERRRRSLTAVTGVLAAADADVIAKAERVLGGLESVEPCADIEYLQAQVEPPADAETAAAVSSLREELARARALADAGKYAPGLELARAAIGPADETGYAPVRAEARRELGALSSLSGDYQGAERMLEEAYWLARKAPFDELAAAAATELMVVVGDKLARNVEGLRWGQHADADLIRAGDDPDLRADWLQAEATLLTGKGAYREAIEVFQRALAIQEERLEPNDPELADALNHFGLQLYRQSQLVEARGYFQRALEIRERSLDPNHPDLAMSYNNVGATLSDQRDFAAAKTQYLRALQIREKALSPEHPHMAMSYNNLGNVSMQLREYETALDYHRQALALREAQLGPRHPDVSQSLYNLSDVYAALKDPAGAQAALERALEIDREVYGAAHPKVAETLDKLARNSLVSLPDRIEMFTEAIRILDDAGVENRTLVYALTGRGIAHSQAGRHADAVADLRRAMPMAGKKTVDPSFGPQVAWFLGCAMWDGKIDRARAVEYVRDARRGFFELGLPTAAADAWLAERGDR